MPIVRIDHPENLVGLDAVAAQREIKDHGYECRIVWRDGRTIVPDYRPDYDPLRVNLHIQNNKVTKATIG